MSFALLVALAFTIAGHLWLLNRRDARATLEREADREERQVLLQRIQAPEAAVYEHATKDLEPDGSSLPLSDEELADREERERVLSFIERHENGHA